MDFLKKIWNFRLEKELWKTAKMRAFRGLCWLIVIMISLTFLSRGADAITIPVVKLEGTKSSTILHTTEISGTLDVSGGKPIIVPSGAMVLDVAVKNGDTVKTGDLLFTYDTSEQMEKIQTMEIDLRKQQLELNDMVEEQKLTDKKLDNQLDRNDEDYFRSEKDYDRQLEAAYDEMRLARVALQKYDGVRHSSLDDDDGESDYSKSEYDSLRSSYRSANLRYQQLLDEREKALEELDRQKEDLQEKKPDSSYEMRLLDLQKSQIELGKLYEDVKNEGKVYATDDGIISGLQVKVGSSTPAELSAFITDKNSLQFKATIDKEQKKQVKVGDKVNLKVYGDSTLHKNFLVSSINPVENGFEITVDITNGKLPLGEGATLIINKKSQKYDTCIPISALYSEGPQNYVLVAKETETMLGTELIAEKVSVTVSDKNASYAAVSGISYGDKVITESTKPVAKGSRIRLERKESE